MKRSENERFLEKQDLAVHREKNFKVELLPCQYGLPGEETVKITYNGFHSLCFDLTPKEQIILVRTLLKGRDIGVNSL